ncbi:hypothetical protein B0O99DRAFT_599514 [Bisporella sp. PMI_857]|nr:hypothetical protein B0O99DRAFT_599514 [Bisporella sp. PMI_857]
MLDTTAGLETLEALFVEICIESAYLEELASQVGRTASTYLGPSEEVEPQVGRVAPICLAWLEEAQERLNSLSGHPCLQLCRHMEAHVSDRTDGVSSWMVWSQRGSCVCRILGMPRHEHFPEFPQLVVGVYMIRGRWCRGASLDDIERLGKQQPLVAHRFRKRSKRHQIEVEVKPFPTCGLAWHTAALVAIPLMSLGVGTGKSGSGIIPLKRIQAAVLNEHVCPPHFSPLLRVFATGVSEGIFHVWPFHELKDHWVSIEEPVEFDCSEGAWCSLSRVLPELVAVHILLEPGYLAASHIYLGMSCITCRPCWKKVTMKGGRVSTTVGF